MPFLYGWQNYIKTAMQTTDNDAYFIFQVIFIPNFIDKPHYVQVLKDKIMVCISGIVYNNNKYDHRRTNAIWIFSNTKDM